MEVTRESVNTIKANIKVISVLHIRINPIEAPINQTQIIATRTHLNVTTCLYLSPKHRARSLSTLIAVSVKTDTVHKIQLETRETS